MSIIGTLWSVEQQPSRVATHAIARMPSARLSLADLELIQSLIEKVQKVTITWSSRDIYSVTASNASAQSPSIKVVRTFEADSIEDFATRAPRGKIYIMEASFESPDGTMILTLGKDRDLRRDLLLSFEGSAGDVPVWFDEIVKALISARLLNAGQREFYLVCLAWTPVFSPVALVPWAITSGYFTKFGPLALLLAVVAAVGWLAYTVFAPTIARFIRASSLRVSPAFASNILPQSIKIPSPSQIIALRLRELRTEMRSALRNGWLAFRQSDHQFNSVLVGLVALVVSLAGTVVSVIALLE